MGVPQVRLREGSSLVIPSRTLANTRLTTAVTSCFPSIPLIDSLLYFPVYPSNDLTNEVAALSGRVLRDHIEATPEGLIALRRAARKVSAHIGCRVAQSLEHFPNMQHGLKRDRYMRALRNILEGQPKDLARITMFVKAERVNVKRLDYIPRAIQFRTAEYCVLLAQYLKPIEHAIYALEGNGVSLPMGRLIGKGLSSFERARLIREYLPDGWAVIQTDLSKFDLHYSESHLKIERSIYLSANPDAEFARLLRMQVHNHGRSMGGVLYHVEGNRMSGDMNTASGACLMMLLLSLAVISHYRIPMESIRLLIDGDDTLWFMPRALADNIMPSLVAFVATLGFVLKLEGYATAIEDVTWCQTRPIEIRPGVYRCVRDYRKVMSNATTNVKYTDSPVAIRRLMAAVGHSELAMGDGVPVLQAYAMALLRNGDSRSLIFDDVDDDYYCARFEARPQGPRQVYPCARVSFARAYGLDPASQILVEGWLDNWRIALDRVIASTPDVARDVMNHPEGYHD